MTIAERRTEAAQGSPADVPNEQTPTGASDEMVAKAMLGYMRASGIFGQYVPKLEELEATQQPATPQKSVVTQILDRLSHRKG